MVFDPKRHVTDTTGNETAYVQARQGAIAQLIEAIKTSPDADQAIRNRTAVVQQISQLEGNVRDTETKYDDVALAALLKAQFGDVPYRESTLSDVLFVAENQAQRTINRTIKQLEGATTSQAVQQLFAEVVEGVNASRQQIQQIFT